MSLVDIFNSALYEIQADQIGRRKSYCKVCRHKKGDACFAPSPYHCPAVQAEVNLVDNEIWLTKHDRYAPWIKEDL